MPEVHGVLPASSSKRWLACPPSAQLNRKLIERFGEETSPYAEEGTKAHSFAEISLRVNTHEINSFNGKKQVEALVGEVTPEMQRAVDTYVDVVLEKYYAAKNECPDAVLMLEQRLDFSPWVPHGFGTGDCVIVSDKIIEVIDLKYGKGVPVSAIENSQTRLYGLGAINLYGSIYGFKEVRMTIVQPRLDSVSEETLTKDELLAWGESIKPTAKLAYAGKGEFKAGDHCKFCAARAICKERALEALDIFKHGFDMPDVLSDEAIPGILKVADTAESWLKDVRAYALKQATNGVRYTGYKLVRGRAPARKWVNEDEVINQLARAGYVEDQYMKPRELMTAAQVEKALGKPAFKALLADYTTQGERALTLVPETDKREEYSPALCEFSDMAHIE